MKESFMTIKIKIKNLCYKKYTYEAYYGFGAAKVFVKNKISISHT